MDFLSSLALGLFALRASEGTRSAAVVNGASAFGHKRIKNERYCEKRHGTSFILNAFFRKSRSKNGGLDSVAGF